MRRPPVNGWFWLGWGCGGAILLLTLLSLLSAVAWHPYFELTSHFKVQYAIISGLLLVGCVRFSKPWFLVALFCLALQCVEILPWYFPAAAAREPNLRVMLSNLYVRNQNPDKVLALIQAEQPDVVVVQEKTPQWMTWLTPIKQQLPYVFEAPDDIAIFSRLPLQNPIIFGSTNQSSIAATIAIAGRKITLISTHPPPPKPDLAQFRNQELKQVATYVQQQHNPVVLIGDLNLTMWSPYYRQLEQQTQLHNTRHGFGILPTWPAPTPFASTPAILAWVKPLLWIPIDHCLVSPTIQVRSLRVGANVDSDHLPLIVDLVIPG